MCKASEGRSQPTWGYFPTSHAGAWSRAGQRKALIRQGFFYFVRVRADRRGRMLHTILQRSCTGFCSASEVGIGDLQVMLHCHRLLVADPGAHHVQRELGSQLGYHDGDHEHSREARPLPRAGRIQRWLSGERVFAERPDSGSERAERDAGRHQVEKTVGLLPRLQQRVFLHLHDRGEPAGLLIILCPWPPVTASG